MATKKEEKEFEKERKAAQKARLKRMKVEGLDKYLTPEQIAYNRRRKVTGAVWPIFRFLILFGLCFIIVYPLIFMLSTAFRPSDQMTDPSVVWIPKSFTMQNLKDTWEIMDYKNTFIRTVTLNLVASLFQVATCAITGYGFARFKFKFKNLLFAIVLLMIIVPPQITAIPLFIQFNQVHLNNTVWAMYLPAIFANGIRAGLFIFIFRQFFRGLPKELEDAAYLDGCGPFKTFLIIMCPNAKSSFLTVFLFSIVWYWNDFYISSQFFTNNDTVALMLKNLNFSIAETLFAGQNVPIRSIISWLEAGCLLSITPILIMYAFLQRYFIEGVERSGLAN